MPTYAQLYQAIPKAGNDPVAKARAVENLLGFVRRELESPRTDADTIKSGLEVMQAHGTTDDIPLIGGLIEHRSREPLKLDPLTLEFAREVKRQLQERFYLLADIRYEEDEFLQASTPVPKDPRSEWLAIRRGQIVAEARDRVDVEAAIARKQGAKSSPYVALIIPVGGIFPDFHERR
jgi:hypothetical protein